MLQVGILGKALSGVEQFATADRGAPDTYVVRILQFGEVGKESMLIEEVDLLLTRELLVACQGDNLHAGSHHEEGHVETDLVVAGTGRTVRNGIGTNLIGIAGDGDSLEDTLAGNGDGVTVVTQHVTENHVFQ